MVGICLPVSSVFPGTAAEYEGGRAAGLWSCKPGASYSCQYGIGCLQRCQCCIAEHIGGRTKDASAQGHCPFAQQPYLQQGRCFQAQMTCTCAWLSQHKTASRCLCQIDFVFSFQQSPLPPHLCVAGQVSDSHRVRIPFPGWSGCRAGSPRLAVF